MSTTGVLLDVLGLGVGSSTSCSVTFRNRLPPASARLTRNGSNVSSPRASSGGSAAARRSRFAAHHPPAARAAEHEQHDDDQQLLQQPAFFLATASDFAFLSSGTGGDARAGSCAGGVGHRRVFDPSPPGSSPAGRRARARVRLCRVGASDAAPVVAELVAPVDVARRRVAGEPAGELRPASRAVGACFGC